MKKLLILSASFVSLMSTTNFFFLRLDRFIQLLNTSSVVIGLELVFSNLCLTVSENLLSLSLQESPNLFVFRVLSLVGFSTARYLYFVRHCCWHRNFLPSTSVFDDVSEFFIIRFSRRVLICSCRVLRLSVSSSVSTRTMYILQVAFRSTKWILWSLSMHQTILSMHQIILFLHPRSSNHQSIFLTIRSAMYVLFWQRRCTSSE